MATAAALRSPIVPSNSRAPTSAKIMINGRVPIPNDIQNLDSFHRWAESDEFPQSGRICYLNGLIWVDLSMEQLFTHVRVKTHIARILDALTEELALGYFFGDGARVSHTEAGLSSEPDAVVASFVAIEAGRVKLIPGRTGGLVRIDGS